MWKALSLLEDGAFLVFQHAIILVMNSTPDMAKDNWYRFGDPDTYSEEIEFDPDVDECEEDDYSETYTGT